ncbi:MAG: CHAT domain-containing protein [Anaerolineales bacterium]
MQLYADLELSLHKFDAGMYSVEFCFNQPGSEADTGLGQDKPVWVELNPADEAFDANVIDPEAYGKALTAALFKDPALQTAFGQARASAQSQSLPLRLRLWISASAPELHRLRWELLRDPQDNSPLSTNENVYFSRYFSSMDWRPVRLQQKGSLCALTVVANPSDLANYKLASIDVAGELGRARAGLADIALTALPADGKPASVDEIISALRAEGSDILYLVCHGVMANGRAILYLEGADGKREAVNGEDFALRIKELQKPPRLAVLVSCQSAGNGSGEALSALGPRLVEAGIPAVIAMQANLRMDTATQFMPAFFRELQKDGQIDRALAAARGMVRKQPDFWAPVLFMRLKSGRLWYTPGFSNQDSGSDYETEIRYISRERCTPIIGPGLLESLLGPSADIARAWAEAFHYPMSPYDRDALPKVAQYLATDKGDAVPFDEYEEAVQRVLRKNFGAELPPEMLTKKWVETDVLAKAIGAKRRAANPLDAYRVLAQLPFPLYISANPDRLLEDALEEAGRKPEVMVSPWNARLASRKTVFDLQPGYEPSAEHPLVFYLFGRWNDRGSLVLTEDEYIKYLIGFTSNKAFVPEQVRLALSDTLLLFLGFETEEWAFRVIFHSILAQAGSGLLGQYAHIAAQIEPQDENTLEPLRARRYLEKYFIKGANINLFWGRADDYLAGLMQKWQENNR